MKIKLTLTFVIWVVCCQAQQLPLLSPMPMSPDAGSVAKYTDIPVQMSTGIPNVSIPLYSYSGISNGLKATIGLSYYAGGIKVSDPGSSVGLGWSFMAGGVITRIMKGKPDYPGTGYDGSRDLSFGTFGSGNTITNDTEADIFTYNFSGNSGRFMIPAATGAVPLLMPQDNVKITYDKNTQTFEAIDTKGVKYIFGAREYMLDENFAQQQLAEWYTTGGTPPNSSTDRYYISAWYLTKILSPTLSDTIVYEYTTPYPAVESVYPTAYGVTSAYYTADQYKKILDLRVKHQTVSLTKISFPNQTKVTFEYGNRTDLSNGKCIATMTINGIRRFDFKYQYLNNRLMLSEIQESANDYVKPSYLFIYNPGALPDRKSCAQDYWGYYNGMTSNQVLAPTDGYQNPNRSVNAVTVANGILTTIQFPTGNVTEFLYEPNDAYIDGSIGTALIGGVRIKKVRNKIPGTSIVQTKEYRYTTSTGISSGVCPKYQDITTLSYGHGVNAVASYGMESGPFFYTRVEVKDSAAQGKIVYHYENPFENYVPSGETNSLPLADVPNWSIGNMKTKEVYDGAGRIVEKIENEYTYFYQSFKADSRYDSYNMLLTPFADNTGYSYSGRKYSQATGRVDLKDVRTSSYTYTDNNIQPDNVLEEKINFEYDNTYHNLKKTIDEKGNSQLITTYSYPYDVTGTVYAQMKNRNMIAAPVDVVTTRYNTQTQVSEQVKRVKTEYKNLGFDDVYLMPSKVYTVNGAGEPADQNISQVFNNYDSKANLLETYKPGDIPQTILWGYNLQYPVAKIAGATLNDVMSQGVNFNVLKKPDSDDALQGEVNALRGKLPKAQITGYTYDTEGNVTSETDVNGKVTYYEYDGFSRLKYVRDENLNILKAYCYESYGLQTECNKWYYNAAIAGKKIRKNNCSEGMFGTIVQTPAIPAQKYKSNLGQAQADAKAINESNSYGQSYANAKGSCDYPGELRCQNNTSNRYVGVRLIGDETFTYVLPPGASSIKVPAGFYTVELSNVTDQNCYGWWNSLSACRDYANKRYQVNVITVAHPNPVQQPADWGQIPGVPSNMLSVELGRLQWNIVGPIFESGRTVWIGKGLALNITFSN